jgi:hypothetical protein
MLREDIRPDRRAARRRHSNDQQPQGDASRIVTCLLQVPGLERKSGNDAVDDDDGAGWARFGGVDSYARGGSLYRFDGA